MKPRRGYFDESAHEMRDSFEQVNACKINRSIIPADYA